MLSTDELKSLQAGEFELDCSHMTAQQEATDNPTTYSGPGLIRQTADRQLEFRLFCTEQSRKPSFKEFFSPDGPEPPGVIIPKHHYYRLSATDLSGRVWESRRIRLDRHIGGKNMVVRGSLVEISHTTDDKQVEEFLSLTFFADDGIPANSDTHIQKRIDDLESESFHRNAARLMYCGMKILLFVEDGRTMLRANATAAMPEHVETRLIEALEFVLGRSMWWCVMVKRTSRTASVHLRSDRVSPKARLKPPIDELHDSFGKSIWPLFGTYLQHVWNFPIGKLHPLSAWLRSVRNVGTSSVFTKGLALGVAIEGVLNEAFSEVVQLPDEYPSHVESAKKHVLAWGGEEGIKRRLEGALQMMLHVRTKDRLHVLKERGVVTAAQIRAWDKFRNSAAHAQLPEDDDLQEWVNLCHVGEVMLYRLIFCAIGYTGIYTDYSATGWTTSTFPSANQSAPEDSSPL